MKSNNKIGLFLSNSFVISNLMFGLIYFGLVNLCMYFLILLRQPLQARRLKVGEKRDPLLTFVTWHPPSGLSLTTHSCSFEAGFESSPSPLTQCLELEKILIPQIAKKSKGKKKVMLIISWLVAYLVLKWSNGLVIYSKEN